MQAFFYSIVIYAVLGVISDSITLPAMVKYGMVISQKIYWFVTAYLLMYAVSPFLNCAVRSMGRKMHLLCCVILLGIFSVAHNLIYISDFGNVLGGSSFLWFCILYIVAAYIRLYVPVVCQHKGKWLAAYGICALMIAVERFVAYAVTPLLFGRVFLESFFYANNSIMNTVAAISLFMAFRSMEIKNDWLQRIIRFAAPLSFGVYLIHDHPAVRELLWRYLNTTAFADSPWMLPYALLCVLVIFLTCILVERLRKWLFQVMRIDMVIKCLAGNVQNRAEAWLCTEE